MKPKQYEELGKGLINLANILGGLSIINGIFGVNHINPVIIPIVAYIVIGLYFSGITLIGEGESQDDWNIYLLGIIYDSNDYICFICKK